MSKSMHAILCLVMSVMLLLSTAVCGFTTVTAAETPVQPRYNYTSYANASIKVNTAGTATCIASAEGYKGTTTKVHIEMKLQKYTALWWSNQQTWEGTFNNFYGTLTKSKTVNNGKYRIKVTFTIYSGNNSEKIEKISNTVTFSS